MLIYIQGRVQGNECFLLNCISPFKCQGPNENYRTFIILFGLTVPHLTSNL